MVGGFRCKFPGLGSTFSCMLELLRSGFKILRSRAREFRFCARSSMSVYAVQGLG